MNPLLALFLMWLGHFAIDFMIGVFSVYKTMAGLDLAYAGMVMLFSAIIGEGLQVYFGDLSDRGYRKFLVFLGIVLTSASSFVIYTQNYYLLFFLVMTTYIGSGSFHPSATGYVSTLSKRRKGLFITIFATGGSLGLAFSQIGFYGAYQLLGQSLYLLAVPSLFLASTLLLFNFGDGALREMNRGKRFSIFNILNLFKRRELRLLYLTQMFNQTLFWATIFLLPDVLHSRGYPDWLSFGGGHLALILGGACMLIPGGYLADRTSPRKVIIAAMSAAMIFFYAFLVFFPTDPSSTLLWLFCLGAALGVVNPVGVAFGNRLCPEKPGLVSAFLMGLVWCVSEGLGPASGILTKAFEPQDAPAQTLMCLGTLNLIGILFASRLPNLTEEEDSVESATI